MKTGLQVLKDIWSLINIQEVTAAISGGIYQIKAPLNSDLVNIVIGLQGVDNEQLQQATVNVNVHVPNMKSDTTMPDLVNIDRICDLLMPLLDSQFRKDFSSDVASPAVIYQENDGSHYANIKVNYYSIQEKFKNI